MGGEGGSADGKGAQWRRFKRRGWRNALPVTCSFFDCRSTNSRRMRASCTSAMMNEPKKMVPRW